MKDYHSVCTVDESETFRANLLDALAKAGLTAAEASRKARLNPRAVKDIEERRTKSPKISTVFALADALDVDPAELLGLDPRPKLHPRTVEFLLQYSEDEQAQIVDALGAIPPRAAS